MSNAHRVLDHIFEMEGGIQNGKPHQEATLIYDKQGNPDKGGPTAFGIASNYHPKLKQKILDLYNHGPSHPNSLTYPEARSYAKTLSWDRVGRVEELPPKWQLYLTDVYFMDSIVRSTAVKALQKDMNRLAPFFRLPLVKVDGWFGPATASTFLNLIKRPHIDALLWSRIKRDAKQEALIVSRGRWDNGYINRWTSRVERSESIA